MPAAEPAAGVGVPRLRRVLTLWDLIFYGIVAVTPSAPATVYGLAALESGGCVVVTILAAMVALASEKFKQTGSTMSRVIRFPFRIHARAERSA